jgi:hypothetical protein
MTKAPRGCAGLVSVVNSDRQSRTYTAVTTVATLRLPHLARRIHALGPRVLSELLAELATAHGGDVLIRAEAYGRLDPMILSALGGDRFPMAPLRLVPS